MKIIHYPARDTWADLSKRPVLDLEYLDSAVRNILTRVKNTGDEALKELALQFDKAKVEQLGVTEREIEDARRSISPELKKAIAKAAENITKFHEQQLQDVVEVETMPGLVCWRKAVPIERVGIYIPGGSAPLFSTILMLAIPAKIARCQEVVLCTPPQPDGAIDPTTLYVASEMAVTKIFKVGGAQAIAAMAYGTETIPAVYKIFGPGNQYVTKAKQLVSQDGTAIDLPAGPSEVLVVADHTANPAFVAADLLSQAEHGADSQVVLVTSDNQLLEEVQNEIKAQLETLPRKEIASKALSNSLGLLIATERDILDFVNAYAPEHLILQTENAEAVAERVVNAGSVFLGEYSPEAVGDYASGTNHTLPTNGFAKAYSGVSLESFMKFITFQKLSKRGISEIGPAVEQMAEAEQLIAHRRAVRIRLNALT